MPSFIAMAIVIRIFIFSWNQWKLRIILLLIRNSIEPNAWGKK